MPRSLTLLLLTTLLAVGSALLPVPSAIAEGQGAQKEHARKLFDAGMQAYGRGELGKSRDLLLQAYKLVRAPELAYNLGRVYERMAEIDDAVRYFRLYMKSKTTTESERRELKARIAELKGFKKRQKQQVFITPPSKSELTDEAKRFFSSGVAMYRRGKYLAAMEAFTHAMRMSPVPEVLFNIAVTAEKLGERRDAIDYFREYLRYQKSERERQLVQDRIRRLRAR